MLAAIIWDNAELVDAFMRELSGLILIPAGIIVLGDIRKLCTHLSN